MNLQTICRFRVLFASVILLLLSHQAFAGALDPTFDGDGKTTVDFPYAATYSSDGVYIFVQPSGRIVVAGRHLQSGPDGTKSGVVMAGLTSGGALDAAFGGSPSNGKMLDWQPNASIGIQDAQMLADGKIMRLGQFVQLFSTFSARLYRLNVNGSSEENFSPDLHVNDQQPLPEKFVVRSDGKIFVIIKNIFQNRHYLIRFNTDGSRDASFGTNGVKELPHLSSITESRIFGMQITPNGKILIAGAAGFTSSTQDYAEMFLLRIDADGNADRAFGRLGLVRQTFGGQRITASDLIVQPDNKYVVVGAVKNPDSDAMMARFTQTGRPDFDFGNAGVIITDFTPGGNDYFNGATLAADGKIIAVGAAVNPPSAFTNFLVAKYAPGGVLEANTQTAFTPAQNSVATETTIQPDGKILVVGFTRNPNSAITGNVFAVARYTQITND